MKTDNCLGNTKMNVELASKILIRNFLGNQKFRLQRYCKKYAEKVQGFGM